MLDTRKLYLTLTGLYKVEQLSGNASKENMIHIRLMQAGFMSMLQTIYLLATCVQRARPYERLSCLKMTHCSIREAGDFEMLSTGSVLAPSKCIVGMPGITQTCAG